MRNFIFALIAFASNAEASIRCEALFETKTLKAAPASVRSLTLQTRDGLPLFVQYQPASNSMLPTLLLMPGVNRSFLSNEAPFVKLAEQGFGVASFHFSAHPFSIATLPQGTRARSRDLSLNDLAVETRIVYSELQRLGVHNVIPISLSYSGAVSPRLEGFPLIIDTAPMTSTAATNPALEQYRQTLRAGELLNPIFGPSITRSMMTQAYRQHWTQHVDGLLNAFPLPKERREEMIEGYTTLSRATEGFVWDARTTTRSRRIFVLAGNEAPEVFKHQLQTFRDLARARRDALMVLVLEAGHILVADQPAAYAQIVRAVVDPKNANASGILVVRPSTGETSHLTGKEAEAYLNKLIEQLR